MNLRTYPGIIDDPNCVKIIDNALQGLDSLGLGKLVQNFCTQTDPEKAADFLFEIWICQMLRRNHAVKALQYEPPGTESPPDFRFLLHGVSFDMQVKRLHNTKNEITRQLFGRECQRRLLRVPKPWFINFRVADHFTRQHLNPFFDYLMRSLDHFFPVDTPNILLGQPCYSWEQGGDTLVQFSFVEKRSREPGIVTGAVSLMGSPGGFMEPIDIDALRKGVDRLLKKSRNSLARPASSTQANLLVVQPVHPVLFADKIMPDALYGSNGLLRPGKFSNISGLILVPVHVSCCSEHFEGVYFPHPSHLQDVQSHPKPFEEMRTYEACKVRHVKWRDKSFLTSENPERWVPEAIADLIEGGSCHSQQILLSNGDSEKIKQGEIVFSTRAEAKAAACELVRRVACNQWGIPEERIQEY